MVEHVVVVDVVGKVLAISEVFLKDTALENELVLREECGAMLEDTLLVDALGEEEDVELATGVQLAMGTDSMLTPDCVPLFNTSYSMQASLR